MTDNILTVKQYLKKTFNVSEEDIENNFEIPVDLDSINWKMYILKGFLINWNISFGIALKRFLLSNFAFWIEVHDELSNFVEL